MQNRNSLKLLRIYVLSSVLCRGVCVGVWLCGCGCVWVCIQNRKLQNSLCSVGNCFASRSNFLLRCVRIKRIREYLTINNSGGEIFRRPPEAGGPLIITIRPDCGNFNRLFLPKYETSRSLSRNPVFLYSVIESGII
jgi:hypothetical protein